ncbi:MAG: rod-binding protein [Spirochaetaceae bacterium]|jgi:flagellar protein FlgJ|nr:rod-binding protein [Spirochaetaceae bacterium]
MSVISAAEFQFDNNRYAIDSLTAMNNTANKIMDEQDFSEILKSNLPANNEINFEDNNEMKLSRKTFVNKKDKLYEQCEALETFLLKTLITGMRKTVEKSEFNKGGFAGEMYEDMLYDEYAKDFTRGAGFGLAELAYLELSGQRGKLMSAQRAEG